MTRPYKPRSHVVNPRPGTRPEMAERNRARANPDAPTRHPLYRTWQGMLSRCEHPSDPDYARYGGRGIAVCESWHTLENFTRDMGPRPPGMTVDRRDNDGNYEPGNCRWATASEQASNRRSTRLIEFNGKRQTLAKWSSETGIGRVLISHRLRAGWSVVEALTKRPSRSLNSRHRRGTKEVCR